MNSKQKTQKQENKEATSLKNILDLLGDFYGRKDLYSMVCEVELERVVEGTLCNLVKAVIMTKATKDTRDLIKRGE